MWFAIAYLLMAVGLLEEAHAKGIKPDWPKTLALMAWIIAFSLAACGVLIWGLEENSAGWGLAGLVAVMALGFATTAIVARRWMIKRG